METILALESSQLSATVVLIRNGRAEVSRTGGVAVAASEALLPLVDGVLSEANLKLDQIGTFSAGVGPGSFTGIRIGCATVKALAQVMDKPVLPFSSIRALALSAESAGSGAVVAMANAYQGQVFAGWQAEGIWTETAMSISDWWAAYGLAVSRQGALLFCGTGATVYRAEIEKVYPQARFAEELQFATAGGVAKAVVEALQKQSAIRYTELHANYLRPSQAEIKLASLPGH